MVVVLCAECGGKVKRKPYYIRRSKIFFCNTTCMALYHTKWKTKEEVYAAKNSRKEVYRDKKRVSDRRWAERRVEKAHSDPEFRRYLTESQRNWRRNKASTDPAYKARIAKYNKEYRKKNLEKIQKRIKERKAALNTNSGLRYPSS